MPTIIRLADSKDLEDIWNIVSACSNWLVKKGFQHWKRYYTKRIVRDKIKKGVYCIIIRKKIVGTVAISPEPPNSYEKRDFALFSVPGASANYITMLAVNPELHGKGYAKKLLLFAENQTKKEKIKYCRLDINGKYAELADFYKRRGYVCVGHRDYPSGGRMSLYEKKII